MEKASAIYPRDRTLAYLSILPSFLIILFLSFLPLLLVIRNSFLRINTGSLDGKFVGLKYYLYFLNDPSFQNAFVNSLIWTFGSVSLDMILGLGLALLLHQNFKFRGLARAAIISPYLMPSIVAITAWRFMMDDFTGIISSGLMKIGIIDTPIGWLSDMNWAMFAVILVSVWKLFPFIVIAVLGILQSIPTELYEAAKIDGAGPFRRFYKITLPFILPVFLLSSLLRAIWTFHKFDIILILTGGGPLDVTTTLPYFVYDAAFNNYRMGQASAAAILMLCILLVLLVTYLVLIKKVEKKS
tara:strand:- start:4076 stop:4972 length:897 start_codon:yes stop_codon:yes gene_type:complete